MTLKNSKKEFTQKFSKIFIGSKFCFLPKWICWSISSHFLRLLKTKDIPYNEKSMNCKHKSEMFAEYLIKMGGKDVYLVTIPHSSGKYSHEFVEWNGHYYDPCNLGLSYLVSKEDYLNKLHRIGFNGLIIQSPYVHHDR